MAEPPDDSVAKEGTRMVASPAPALDLVAEVPVARMVTSADLADFVDELAVYQADYASYFRPDQRGWAAFYSPPDNDSDRAV